MTPKKYTKWGRIKYTKFGGLRTVKKYSNEFKKAVIDDYYSSPLGVRAITLKYGLPSKNYISRWEEQLKEIGMLPKEATKPNKAVGRSSEQLTRQDDRTPREKQYELEIEILKARVEYFEGLDYMQPFIKKKEKYER